MNLDLDIQSPFFTLSPELMAFADASGRLVKVNPAWERTLGFPPGELEGRPFLERVHPQDRPRVMTEIGKLSLGDNPETSFEAQAPDRGLSLRCFRWSWRIVGGGYYLIGRDITDLRRAEQALSESRETFQKFNDSTSDGMAIHAEAVILEANPALARMFGYAKVEEMVGLSGLDLTTPEGREEILRHLKSGSSEPYEVTGVRRDGSLFPCRLQGREILYQGRPARVSTFQDLTGLKELEKGTRQEEEKFRALCEMAREGVALSQQGKILEVNSALARMFGYEPSEMVGRGVLEFTAPESRELLARMVLSDKQAPYRAIGLRKDGSHVALQIQGREVVLQGHSVRLAVFREEEGPLPRDEASHSRLRAVFNGAFQSMIVLDRGGRVEIFNRGAAEEMKRVRGAVLETGRDFTDYFEGPLREVFRERFEQALSGKTARFERLVPGLRRRDHWYEFQVHPILEGKERATGVCVTFTAIGPRKGAEETLRQSEERFRRLFEDTSLGMSLAGPDHRFFRANRAFQELLGYNEKELSKLTFRDITHPEDLPRNVELVEKLVRGQGFQIQKRYRTKGGEVVWANLTVTPFLDAEGRFLHSLGVIEDITEHKRAEKTLSESEERYRRLVEFSPDGIFVSVKEKIVYVNPAGLRMLGAQSPDQVVGRPVVSLAAPETRTIVRERLRNVNQRRGTNAPLEQKFARLDGQTIAVEAQSTYFNYMGRPGGLMIARDISQRQKAVEAFQETQESYRRLVEFFPETVLVHSEDRILYINPPGLKMFGAAEPREILGRSVYDLVSTPFVETARIRVESIYLNKLSTDPMDQVWLKLDGTPIDVEIRGTFFSFMGKPAVLSILRNVSERKRTQQMLLRYERLAAVGQVIAGIAHDIRNPLTILSSMTAHLREKFGRESRDLREVETIAAQTERLKRLMNDILDYAKGLTLAKRAIDPKPFLEHSLRLVEAQLGSSRPKVEVEWDLPRPLKPFRADKERLEQVMVNLILNAYEALEKRGGTVTLSFEEGEQEVRLRVKDDGPGIPEAAVTRLFEPFFTTKKYGSGLGLSVCQKIVDAHGGRIEVEWVYPHGTLFTVILPKGIA